MYRSSNDILVSSLTQTGSDFKSDPCIADWDFALGQVRASLPTTQIRDAQSYPLARYHPVSNTRGQLQHLASQPTDYANFGHFKPKAVALVARG